MFSYVDGKTYCRRCIKFKGKEANIAKYINPRYTKARLDYSLSKEQTDLSNKIISSSDDIYVNAVCGAGKTEITFAAIEKALASGKRVGYFIPRRAVVKEIVTRLRKAYPNIIISEVYGGHTQILDGEIIVLTTHQAYRYHDVFGLIIVDEYDAFPFKDDELLKDLVNRSCYGKKIYLSATFTRKDLEAKHSLSLNKRYHNKPLPLPTFINVDEALMFLMVLRKAKEIVQSKNIVFIYLPTIKKARNYYLGFKRFFANVGLFHSKLDNKSEVFNNIKSNTYDVVITTTILERGITIKNLDVIVAYADDEVFDTSTLIQIAGRVGRSIEKSDGKIYFLAKNKSKSIEECISRINDTNKKLLIMQ